MQFWVKRQLGWGKGVACISLWILMKDDVGMFFLFVCLPLTITLQYQFICTIHFRVCLTFIEKIPEQAGAHLLSSLPCARSFCFTKHTGD